MKRLSWWERENVFATEQSLATKGIKNPEVLNNQEHILQEKETKKKSVKMHRRRNGDKKKRGINYYTLTRKRSEGKS